MTIKAWFYKHRNVTLLLLAFLAFVNFKAWYDMLIDQRWGWLVFYSLTSVVLINNTINWWENEQ